MGQREVLNLLEKSKEPLSISEISKKINEHPNKISKHLSQMLKYSEVCFIEIDRLLAMEKYNCKRRMRLWFVDDSNN